MEKKTDNIDILEEFIKHGGYQKNGMPISYIEIPYPVLRQAISNLIAENKELKEENARLKNKNSFDVYKMGQESQRSRIERDYIPKIKVREALKEEQERLKKGLGKFYNNDLGNSATRILQSLLGKE